jgi:ribose transport system substrate-binding protein
VPRQMRRDVHLGRAEDLGADPRLAQDETYTIALIPGLTTDAFYITMQRGAQAAADALGVELVFQGAPDFNPVTQVPVLDAVIARAPDAILIAPTDVTQLDRAAAPRPRGRHRRHHRRHLHRHGVYQTGSGDADFPLSYIASDNVLGGRIAARALAEAIGGEGKVYVSNVNPGISTTDQREEGFKLEMAENFPGVEVLETQFNENDANNAASQLQAVSRATPISRASSAPTCSRRSARRTACSRRASPATSASSPSTRRAASSTTSRPASSTWPSPSTRPKSAISASSAYAHLTGQSIPVAIGTGFTIIDASNVDDPEVARYIYSD